MLLQTDSENLVEFERRSNKPLLVKHAIGSLLPGLADTEIAQICNVLEVGCGPGTWSLEMAQTYYRYQMQITGIDTSGLMVARANTETQDRHLDNIRHLQVPSLAGPFAFEDNSFDLISAQFLSLLLDSTSWISLVRECRRMLRSGGWLFLTDFEAGLSNAPAHEELWSLFIQAMHRSGHSFSQSDRHLGLLCEMEPFLFSAGFHDTRCIGHMINYSSGALLHEEWKRDFFLFMKGIQSMLIETGVVTQERLIALYQQQQREMNLQSFHGVLPMLTVWGRK
jgi:SAM-dependent methyltransferase